MSRSGRFLFIGFLVPDEEGDRIFEGERQPQISAVRFQRGLVRAFAAAGVCLDAVTTPPIAPFPRSRHWWVAGVDYAFPELNLRGRQISGLNLPGVRLILRLMQGLRHGLPALRAPCEGILVYSVHTPFLLASLLLKRLRGVPVFVFIPDMPPFMGGPSNPLKRLMKRVDDVIVRRLLMYTDGAFPITDGIGRDWLTRGPKYCPLEGVSDEAAAMLKRARANGAYVARARQRPRLLYTGTLAQVMTFAHAFHKSAIDASVVFVGGGEDFTQLEALASSDKRIQVKPFMTGAELAGEVDRADFLLNPRDPSWRGSAYSFPSKLFEYLRSGKPVISTRLGGIPPEYFAVFRPIDLLDQPSFEASLERALLADENPDAIWNAAERLAERLASPSVGTRLLTRIRDWTA